MRDIVYQGHWFSMRTEANGVEYVHTGDEVLIVPPTAEGEVILIHEPSAALLEMSDGAQLRLTGPRLDARQARG